MTTVVNLYGGPGTGKSTSAAYIFYLMKQSGKNVELVREYVKSWAWEQRKIAVYDQLYFLGKQVRQESMLYGKVDYIVTDSPILMNVYYADRYAHEMYLGVSRAVGAYYDQAKNDGHRHVHVLLNRSKPYNPAGRFQDEDQAKEIDIGVAELLVDHAADTLITCETDSTSLEKLIEMI